MATMTKSEWRELSQRARANNGRDLVGRAVSLETQGVTVFWGVAEYVTGDGWAGIRQLGGRLDEAPLDHVYVDPT